MSSIDEAERPSPLAPYFSAIGSPDSILTDDDLYKQIASLLEAVGPRDDVLILPPDYTRQHSYAGKLTQMVCQYYKFIKVDAEKDYSSTATENVKSEISNSNDDNKPTIQIMPALGTHAPMTNREIKSMFGDKLANMHTSNSNPFLIHRWRTDVETIGYVPAEMVTKATHGRVKDQPWPVQLNKVVWNKRMYDSNKQKHKSLVLSIGQVVPHEVMGMANYNKNLLVGTGGVEAIHWSHFIGAVHGMETIMGQAHHPLRDILEYASRNYLEPQLDLWYILTVVSPDSTGKLCVRGLFVGNNVECYNRACELSLQVNFTSVERPFKRCVVYLNEDEFHSTWLGNKAIYRTRLAMANHGHLIVLAPGVERFGEDEDIDRLIRLYGYRGTPATLQAMDENDELQKSLSVVAHLIHGSSEGRFTVTYCPGKLSRDEIESVGFEYQDLDKMLQKYNVKELNTGWHTDEDGEFYFITNPALGLWADESRLNKNKSNDNTDQR